MPCRRRTFNLTPGPAPRGDHSTLQRNFDALRRLVDQARRRRAAWALSVPAVVFLTLVNGILHGLGGR